MKSNLNNTIFALSTNFGPSAIAVFRISGNECKNIAKTICKIKKLKDRYAHYCKIIDLKSNLIDKGIIIFFKAPKSYTGEDLLEIHLHGSIAIVKKLTYVLSKMHNTRAALPGEFSKRAFYNGKGDLLHFEGINNLINAETENQRIIANKQVYGANSKKCADWRIKIIEILAILDANIEFTEDMEEINTTKLILDIEKIKTETQSICAYFENAKNLMHGSKILIVGPTNAGKSSLFNFLIQRNQMIVSSKQGTTTDLSEQSIEILGQKINLIDSAGIRDSKKTIEKSGINKMFEKLEEVHRIIIVLSPDSIKIDSVNKLTTLINKRSSKEMVIVFNKSDLNESEKGFCIWKDKIPELRKLKSITISCKNNFDNNNMLKKLYKFIYTNLLSVDTNSDDYYFSEVRQIECLKKITENLQMAIKHIEALELSSKFLRDAISELDNLYGKHDHENELEIIFNNFCIGK